MRAKELYHVGIYLRLSRDDEDMAGAKTESNSISSQRELIRSFVRQHEDMEIYDIYVDDGWSGVNFDRPEFKRMMADIEAGEVDCVIVKDLSRFGRDYIEAGRLIQKAFPALNVRFIAITDHFDTLTADYNETTLVLPVKNFVNDSYSRDISNKVRSQKEIKRKRGDFIGAFTVYGYCKDSRNRNHLVIDEYAAGIVRNIFRWKLEGMSNSAIADKLNGMGILSPMEYKISKGERYSTGFSTGIKTAWSSIAVKRILINELYIGTMVQGKQEKINYKLDKYRERPPEEWVRVENVHEAIVSKEDFENVQRLLLTKFRAVQGGTKAQLFSGFLFCGDCGKPMSRRMYRYKGKENVYFACPNRKQGCTIHRISEEDLKKALLDGLKLQALLLLDEAKILPYIQQMEVNFEEVEQFDKELLRLHTEEEKYLSLRSGLYEDLKEGIITQEDFKDFRAIFEEQYVRTQEAIRKQEELIKALFKNGVASGVRLERFKELKELTILDRDVLLTFVERVFVYEDKRIRVELRHKEQFSKLSMLAEYAKHKGISVEDLSEIGREEA